MTQKRTHEMTHMERVRRRDRIILRRRIFLGVVIGILFLLLVLLVLHIKAAVEPRADVNTLTVAGDGSIIYEEITDVNGYNASDMKKYVRQQIKAYNDSHDINDVKLERFAEKKAKVYVRTKYKDAKVYADFTGYPLTTGTVKNALKNQKKAENNTAFEGSFVTVKNGKKSSSISAEKLNEALKKHPRYRYLIIEENTVVKVEGSIRYVTDESTKVQSKDTVTIAQADGNPDATTQTCIIYQ